MTSLTARRLSPPDTTVVATEIALCGVAAVCDLGGALYLPDLDTWSSRTFISKKVRPSPDAASFCRLMIRWRRCACSRRRDPLSAEDGHQPRRQFHDRVGSALMPLPFREMILAMARGRDFIWINGNHDPDGTTDLPGISADEITLAGLTFRHEPSLAHGGEKSPDISIRRPLFVAGTNPCAGPASPPMATVW